MRERCVFDTTTIVSALLFQSGRLAWLREHWQSESTPLISRETTEELARVLAYPKFRLSPEERDELLAEYLPYCEIIEPRQHCPVACRDANDQPFLDLAQSGSADVLITGDKDLLVLAGKTIFVIETPESFRKKGRESAAIIRNPRHVEVEE